MILFAGVITAFYGVHSAILMNQGAAISKLNDKIDRLIFMLIEKDKPIK
jgi:hypothetical protein